MARMSYEEFIKKAREIHGNKYQYPDKETFDKTYPKIKVVCPKHGEFTLYATLHVNEKYKYACRKCGYENRKPKPKISKEEMIRRFRKVHGDKYDYSKVNPGKTTKVPVTIICPIHGEYEQLPATHMKGAGCRKCAGKHQHTSEEWVELAKSIRGDEYDYSKTKYFNKTTKVLITCKKHGDFWQIPGDHLYKGAGCNVCNASKPELLIWEFLKKENIKFEFQKTFEGYRYEYDFYLTDLNILIEYNGGQHYKYVKQWHTDEKGYEHIVERDKKKKELAKILGIPLIIIKYDVGDILDYLMFEIAKIYKYRVGNVFYKRFTDVVKGLNLPSNTTVKDVEQYKTYKK